MLADNELLISRWSPIHLATMLKGWFWKDGRTDINALQVWQQTCNYVYLPRLLNSPVFQNAISDGIKSRDFFGFAAGKEGDQYKGLLFGEAGAVYLDDSGLLVTPSAAQRQVDAVRDAAAGGIGADAPGQGYGGAASGQESGGGENVGGTEAGGVGAGKSTGAGSATTKQPTRFYGTLELDPVSASMDFAKVMTEVVQHFTAKYGSKVTIAVEVSATDPDGFDEHRQRTVKTNCGVLKLSSGKRVGETGKGVRRNALRRTDSRRGDPGPRGPLSGAATVESLRVGYPGDLPGLYDSGAWLHWPTAYQLAQAADWSAPDPEMGGGPLVPAATESRTSFPCLQSWRSANPEIALLAFGPSRRRIQE